MCAVCRCSYVCQCRSMFICINIQIYMSKHMYVLMYIGMCVCMHACMHACICARAYIDV